MGFGRDEVRRFGKKRVFKGETWEKEKKAFNGKRSNWEGEIRREREGSVW